MSYDHATASRLGDGDPVSEEKKISTVKEMVLNQQRLLLFTQTSSTPHGQGHCMLWHTGFSPTRRSS